MKVKFADFHQITRSRSFPAAIAHHDLLRQSSIELVRTLLPTKKGIRLLGVTVSNFDRSPMNAVDELPLFETASLISPRPHPMSGPAPAGVRSRIRQHVPAATRRWQLMRKTAIALHVLATA